MAPEGKNHRPMCVGARVAILQSKHLKCAEHGFVQYIDGAYIYVRPENAAPVESDACEQAFELYSGELKFIAAYQHPRFAPGVIVRIKELEWRNVKAKTHGIVIGVEAERILVQPLGAHKGAIVSVLPASLEVEANQLNQKPQSVAIQSAICSLLKALGLITLTRLQRLLSTQAGLSVELEANLARLANNGKIDLSESQASLRHSAAKSTEALALDQALASHVEAEARLAEAIRQVILKG